MAYVKIISCKTKSPTRSIAYITESEKLKNNTNKEVLKYIKDDTKVFKTYYSNCINGMEDRQFKIAQDLYAANKNYRVRDDNVNYFHVIQSFKPGETSPEEAYEIGKKLIKENYGPNVQMVMATHIDKGHIHNHFIVNSVSISGKKFYHNNAALNNLRNTSDKICLEHGLSVIKPKEKSKSYKEWQMGKEGSSWKEDVRIDIDKAILISNNFSDFKNNLKKQGYEFKEPRKHLTIRKKGFDRFIRTRTLGADYTEDRIKDRISNEHKLHIADYSNKGKPTPVPIFIKQKRKQYEIMNAVMALKYLNALELVFRILINGLFSNRRKWDLRKPYIVMNDFAVRKILEALKSEEDKLRKKEKTTEINKDKNQRR